MSYGRIELGAVGLQGADITGELDDEALHAQANTKIGNFVDPSIADGTEHPFDPTGTESAGDQDSVQILELFFPLLAHQALGFDPLQLDLGSVGQPTVQKSLAETLIGILIPNILADDPDRDFFVRLLDTGHQFLPRLEIVRMFRQLQLPGDE